MKDEKVGFLYGKCLLNGGDIAFWLSVPEFYETISRFVDNSVTVTDELLFYVMRKIYFNRVEAGKDSREHKFSRMRHTMKTYCKRMFDNKSIWETVQVELPRNFNEGRDLYLGEE